VSELAGETFDAFETGDGFPDPPAETRAPIPGGGVVTDQFVNGKTADQYAAEVDDWLEQANAQPAESDDLEPLTSEQGFQLDPRVEQFAQGALSNPDPVVRDWANRALSGDPSALAELEQAQNVTAQQHYLTNPAAAIGDALDRRDSSFAEALIGAAEARADWRDRQQAAYDQELAQAEATFVEMTAAALADKGLSDYAAERALESAQGYASEWLTQAQADLRAQGHDEATVQNVSAQWAERAIREGADKAYADARYEQVTAHTQVGQWRARQAEQARADEAAGREPVPDQWEKFPGLRKMGARMFAEVEAKANDPRAAWQAAHGFTPEMLERMKAAR
jgi:hypothetical protein